MVQKYSEEATSPKKQKRKKQEQKNDAVVGQLRVAVEAHAYRRTEND